MSVYFETYTAFTPKLKLYSKWCRLASIYRHDSAEASLTPLVSLRFGVNAVLANCNSVHTYG